MLKLNLFYMLYGIFGYLLWSLLIGENTVSWFFIKAIMFYCIVIFSGWKFLVRIYK